MRSQMIWEGMNKKTYTTVCKNNINFFLIMYKVNIYKIPSTL